MRALMCLLVVGLALALVAQMAILIHLLLSLLLCYACPVNLDCAPGSCLRRGDGQYECSCPAGYVGKRCEQVVTFKRDLSPPRLPHVSVRMRGTARII